MSEVMLQAGNNSAEIDASVSPSRWSERGTNKGTNDRQIRNKAEYTTNTH